MSNNVQISLLGRSYTLRSHESEEDVHRVVRFVEERLSEMSGGKSVDTRDLTTLTLLNLAGQYLQLSREHVEEGLPQNERLEQIVSHLEQELGDNSGC